MSQSLTPRQSTLAAIAADLPKAPDRSRENPILVSKYFGERTFGLGHMREKLPRDTFNALLHALEEGEKLPRAAADAIANAVREWALAHGATHFCHWFQPMTGLTAEKHDAFLSVESMKHSELKVLERFSGSQLVQGEPDASSFPSGGMRSTFEARGYTAWDPSSPLFLLSGERGNTLCIPSIFIGYHGEALDNKGPLLRSVQALSKSAVEFLHTMGDTQAKSVTVTLGPEQEYFLIDKRLVALRPDLLLTGRTLLGAASPRGQQLEDHYFGSIPSRVKAFMEDMEYELFRLGVPIKTRHNEVAPSQFELAPIFEPVNIASDHNALAMEMMKRVALRHGFVCLLHEKPFAGINGTGKHCNWSLSTDRGENLLDPGTTPHQNVRFLAFVAITLTAVHRHAAPLRAAIASAGNDHRLGGNEAPPAILSAFMGSLLNSILDTIEKGQIAQATESQILNLGISHIPDISKDYTDRNRTSPFAFTGNKFEFRAVGGSANVAVPMTFLNAAVSSVLQEATTKLKALRTKKPNIEEALIELTRDYIKESKAIRFEGNNYSQEWQQEAKKRGLPVLNTTKEALQVLGDAKAMHFLEATSVLTKEEIHSRFHIAVERFNKTLEIELDSLLQLAVEQVVPTVEKQLIQTKAAEAALSSSAAKKMGEDRRHKLEQVYASILENADALGKALHTTVDGDAARTKLLCESASPLARTLRQACDTAEGLVDDALWPLPKYRELLFAHLLG